MRPGGQEHSHDSGVREPPFKHLSKRIKSHSERKPVKAKPARRLVIKTNAKAGDGKMTVTASVTGGALLAASAVDVGLSTILNRSVRFELKEK